MRDSFSGGDVRVKWAIAIIAGTVGIVLGALIGRGII